MVRLRFAKALMVPAPIFHARIKLLSTNEGGRQTDLIPGYRPQLHFEYEEDGWAIQITTLSPCPFPPTRTLRMSTSPQPLHLPTLTGND